MVTQGQKWGTGVRGERPNLQLSSTGCPRYWKRSSKVRHGRNYTTGSTTAPRSYSILLSSCLFISILILVHLRSKVYTHIGNLSLQLTFWPLTPALSATRLVVWQYARATRVCPVEASTPTCSVTASVPSRWRPSRRLGTVLSQTLWGGFNADMWQCLNEREHRSPETLWEQVYHVSVALERAEMIMGNIGSCVFEGWPILGTQSYDISAAHPDLMEVQYQITGVHEIGIDVQSLFLSAPPALPLQQCGTRAVDSNVTITGT